MATVKIGTLLIRVKHQTPILVPPDSSKYYTPRHSPSPSAHVSKPKHESTPRIPPLPNRHSRQTNAQTRELPQPLRLPRTDALPVRSAFTHGTSRRNPDRTTPTPALRDSGDRERRQLPRGGLPLRHCRGTHCRGELALVAE